MKTPLNWLNDFVEVGDINPEIIAHEVTMTGTKSEGILHPGKDIKNVVTGRIESIIKHPDADKLVVCKVNSGNRVLNIVTGADNIKEGDIVPVALDGAILAGNLKIKSGQLRGVQSEGMLCSIQELGFSAEEFPDAHPNGIYILDSKVPVGEDILKALDLGKPVIDFEITSNRPDCLSIEGIAREIAITMNLDFKEIHPKVTGISDFSINDYLRVEIKDPDLCYRYVARMVKNIKIQKSPGWMISRLRQCGIKPINNIVDITNYVMLELGQPMHAFDYKNISGGKIVVRRSDNEEIMTTLDDVKHELTKDMLVIADQETPSALAGIMGGKNSQINPDTEMIVFESANFNGINIRLTAKKLGMRTESSSRFEKSLDPENAKRAIDRACELIELLGCGEVSYNEIDVYPGKFKDNLIEFRPNKINSFLGTEISSTKMTEILEKIGCKKIVKNEIELFQIPSFRADIEQEVDICEEIARFYGYNNIVPTLLSGKSTTLGGLNKVQKQRACISGFLRSRGYYEACTYSFIGKKSFDKILLPESDPLRKAVTIFNPLGEDFSLMRTTMLPSLIQSAALNFSRGTLDFKIFEIAKVYIPKSDINNELPNEREIIAGIYSFENVNTDSHNPFLEIKGEISSMLGNLELIKNLEYVQCKNNPSFHPGRTANIYSNELYIGIIGFIHPDLAKLCEISQNTIVFMLEFDNIRKMQEVKNSFLPLPKYPEISRDLAIIVAKETPAGEVEKTICENAGELLESIRLFDVFTGKQIEDNKKSLAYNLVFRSKNSTLTDKEINPFIDNILNELYLKYSAILR